MGETKLTSMNYFHFQKALLKWWKKNKRKYPWRFTKDPYKILISEILLHRTKAEQVVPIYIEFIDKFPSIEDLANVSYEEVKKIVYPLGLHWRTRLLKKMAAHIMNKYDGKIPIEREKLLLLPGISDYIASAFRCFVYGEPEVLLDTNTVRILGRVFGMKITDASRRSRQFKELYKAVLDKKHPREFNYAMIDLGALLCKPSNPKCSTCPLEKLCAYASSRDVK